MNAKWRLLLVRFTRRLWFRPALYGCYGIATALVGAIAKPLISPGIATVIGASAVGHVLDILATSMLVVTIFSLSTMVAAYAAASSSATPRAATLLIQDTGTQHALATFLGAFLFSVVGLVALSTGIYGDSGRLILFVATVAVIITIVITLLRWIDQISRLGRVNETIDLVERATHDAMRAQAQAPWLHAMPYSTPPADAVSIESRRIGYITYVDIARLQSLAVDEDVQVWAEVAAGSFVAPGRAIARLSRAVDEELAGRFVDAFVVDDLRNFDQDPRFGLVVLTEIALRALSPAMNDPGTAIDIIGTVTRLLCRWAEARQNIEAEQVRHDRIYVRALDEQDYFEDVYAPLARDSAGILEVAIQLQKSLATLGQLGYPRYRAAAIIHARRALQLAEARLTLDSDRQRLRDIASWSIEPT
ncbi:MAG TPA: DUF2254 domain-containing protein [Rhodanobacter sp.]|nr:DUF2254 domain-containing protein [Rhodanobacter sp.]